MPFPYALNCGLLDANFSVSNTGSQTRLNYDLLRRRIKAMAPRPSTAKVAGSGVVVSLTLSTKTEDERLESVVNLKTKAFDVPFIKDKTLICL